MDYYIDNYNFKGFGIYVQESTGVVDLPKFKPPTETDWAEYHGVIVDSEKTPRTEARTIQLKCFLKAENQVDFLTKLSAFQSVFMTKGLKRLAIILTNEVGLFFDVYMSDGLQVTKRWSDSTMVGQFTVNLCEPEPIKKIIRFDSQGSASTLSFKTSEAVSVYWGDGSAQQDLYGNVSLSHTYDESGIYFAIIHGNIDNITDLTTSGDVLTTNNGGNIEIEIPEILNGALESVELFNVAEPGISQLTPYIRFAFNNNSETRYLRITIDANDEWLEQIAIINNRLDTMSTSITALQSGKADKSELTPLQQSITTNTTNIASNTTAITTINNKIGSANGIAELDTNGKVPQSQLPSFVDDVEEYSTLSNFPATGESGKIYIATDTNITYRWGGSTYVPIGSDLALGETASTAYRGDRGKTAYDHSQTQGNPHNTTIAQISGLQTALNGKQPKIGKNEFLKQVSDLDNYTASQNGEIVEYVGATDSKYTHGYVYERDTSKDIAVGTKMLHITNSESFPHNAQIVATNPIVIESGDYILDSTSDNHTITTYTVNRRINASYTHQGYIDCYGILTHNNTYLVWFRSTLTSMLIELSYTNNEWVDEEGKTYDIINSEQYTYKEYTFYNDNSKKVLAEQNDSDVYYYVQSFARIGGGSTNILIRTDHLNTIETSAEDVIFWQQTDVQPRTDTSTIESDIAALQTNKANEITSFTESSTRTNITSGDTVTTIWGKIKKFFTDLKAVAFSGSYNDLSNKPSKNYALGTDVPLITTESTSSAYYTIASDIVKGEKYNVNFDMVVLQTITFSTINPIYIYYNSDSFLWIVSSGTYQVGEYHITKSISVPSTFSNPRFYITANDSSIRGSVLVKNCRIERENDNGWQPNTSDEQIYFTSNTVSGNIASGETLAVMFKKINVALGQTVVTNSNWTLTEYINSSNLYGILYKTLGILIINGWFRLIETDIPRYSRLFKLNGYTLAIGYPTFFTEDLLNGERNSCKTRSGESGSDGYFLFVNRTTASPDTYFEGLPTVINVYPES